MSSSKLFLLFLTFVASVGALSTPHVRGIHHRALAGRIAVPESPDMPPVAVRKRQNSKRCKPRHSSAALAVSAKETSSTNEPASTKEAPTTKETQVPTTHKDPPPPPPTTTHKASLTPKPAPKPTKEAPPPPATTKKPAPAPASDLPSYLTGTNSGDATFYASEFSLIRSIYSIYSL
jgi:outer membrane biosynthesis protein TonB